MKKFLSLALALIMTVSFVACTAEKKDETTTESTAATTETNVEETEEVSKAITVNPAAYTDKYYEIKNAGTGKMLNVQESKSANNVNIYMYKKDGTPAQQFKFKYNSKYGGYTITPKCATSRMVNVYGTTAKNKANVCSYTASSSSTQTWVLKTVGDGVVLCCADNQNLVLTATGSANKSNVDIETYNSKNRNQVWTSAAFYTKISNITTTKAKTSFTPRKSAPAMSGYYANYWSNNCTRYVCCRVNEILKKNFFKVTYGAASPAGTGTGTGSIYQKLKSAGYKTGKLPKVGAVMVSSGHVAVVESISGNVITCSNGNSITAMSNGGSVSGVVAYRNLPKGGNTKTKGSKPGCWFYMRKHTYNTSTGVPSGFSGTWCEYVYLV